MEQRGKIGVACRNEGVDIGLGSVATGQGFVPRNAPEGRSLGALPLPAPSCQTAQLAPQPTVRYKELPPAADRLMTLLGHRQQGRPRERLVGLYDLDRDTQEAWLPWESFANPKAPGSRNCFEDLF
jgi:hypothetical protein